MKRRFVFSGTILSFLCGVFILDIFRDDRILISIFVWPFLLFFSRIPLKIIFLWGSGFTLGLLRVFLAISSPSPEDIAFYAKEYEQSQQVKITGIVSSFPDIRADQTKVYVQVERIEFAQDIQQAVHGKILVNLPKYPTISYGDTLKISGKLMIPPEFEEFSYRRFLEKEQVYAYMPRSSMQILEQGNGNTLFHFLFFLRTQVENTLRDRLPEPEASFAVGILLGGERGFTDEVRADFRASGLTHLLALSGSNITILILFVFWVFRFLPKKYNLCLTILFVTGFVLLTGASSSVVRAAVMGLLSLFILHGGAQGKPLYILLWSMLGMVLWNPFLLRSDVSFQLSVAAVVGLIIFVPLWQNIFVHVPAIFGFREALQTTLAAQITAVPLVAFYFARVSLISPVANLLVTPLIPFAMLCSFLALFPVIGSIFAFIAYGILKLGLFWAHFFAQLPFADVGFSVGIVGLLIIYTVIFGWIWWRKKHHATAKIS